MGDILDAATFVSTQVGTIDPESFRELTNRPRAVARNPGKFSRVNRSYQSS